MKAGAYVGTFIVAFSMLSLEVTLTRLLSVITWYHLAFFAVSTAMLGMTAGATTVYLRPDLFTRERVERSIAHACMAFALTIPFSLVLLCLTPLNLPTSPMGLAALFQATIACSLPFYCAGVAIAAVLTKLSLPIGRTYASDLLGASLGSLFVLGGLEILDAPTLILACSPLAALAGFCFCLNNPDSRLRHRSLVLLGALALLVICNATLPRGISPVVVKGVVMEPDDDLLVRWNSFSSVIVLKGGFKLPQLWGASPKAPVDSMIFQYKMRIDGLASTTLRRFRSMEYIDHLLYDVTNVAYYLGRSGAACIIGVGSGRDILSALRFGHEPVVGVEVNPIFIDLLNNEFRDFAGIADRDDVTLVVDEARTFLSRTKGSFSIIQMSLIDTWAATVTGAFSLSENALYTIEAWTTLLDDLADDGVFTVSRWYDPVNLGETGRMLSLAVATLVTAGARDPSQHIAMVTSGRICTLILTKQPFTWTDVGSLQRVCAALEYGLPLAPGLAPRDATLKAILASRSQDQLRAATAHMALNCEPPTDDNPYFFNMLRLSQIRSTPWLSEGVMRGNVIATLTLIGLVCCLAILAAVTIVIPLLVTHHGRRERAGPLSWSGAAYFSLIGAGFMFVEIALIQRLSVFLGHPVYALSVLLLTIIASAGLGSLLSEVLPLTRTPWLFAFPIVIVALVLATRFALPVLSSAMATASMVPRIVASVAAITPVGLCLGVCFPTGMRVVARHTSDDTPWYWALNGVFGVLCSAVAVLLSISYGISFTLYVGSACYALLLLCIPGMTRAAHRDPSGA